MLKYTNRLTKRKEFGFLYRNGRKISNNNFIVVYIPTKYNSLRFGISVTKKVGIAVVRNKIKRQIREIIRLNLLKFNNAYNYIIIPKPESVKLTYQELNSSLLELLTKYKLFTI